MYTVFYQLDHSFITTATLAIFIITYMGLALGHLYFVKLDRTGIALLGGIAMLAFGCLSLTQAVEAVSMPSILLLFGLMVIASQLHFAGFYRLVADRLSNFMEHPALFLAVLMGAGGALSAFLNNDVVVLSVTPLCCSALLRKKLNPTPFLIGLALASNIGCAWTTIGSAQNVLIGEIGHLSFGRYIMFATVPVLLSLGMAYGVVYFLARGTFAMPESLTSASLPFSNEPPVDRWRCIKGIGILILLVVLFIASPFPRDLLALTGAGLLLCSHRLASREVLSQVNWQLLVLFIGLFVVVGGLVHSGVAEKLLPHLKQVGINLDQPLPLAWGSAILSNLINNSATVMLLVKLIDLSNPINAYALALSNAFAGNFLLIGSLANIITVQCAEECGCKISFREFARYGIPVGGLSMLILSAYLLFFL